MLVDEVTEVLRIPQSNIVSTQQIIETNISHRYITGVGKLENRLIILINLNEILTVEEIEQVHHIKEKTEKAPHSD
jgi:purine-binding chemotaxis protein CheW